MKLYNFSLALNGKRVNAFMREKGVSLETHELNIRKDEQFAEPFKSMNPFNCIPFLQLDNGTVISESISICRYLDEHFPGPVLFGDNPERRAVIDMWNRRLELDGLVPVGSAVRNKLPFFKGKVIAGTRNEIPQEAIIVGRAIESMNLLFKRINQHLKDNRFIAGVDFSVADITGYFLLSAGDALDYHIDEKFEYVLRWRKTLSEKDCFFDR